MKCTCCAVCNICTFYKLGKKATGFGMENAKNAIVIELKLDFCYITYIVVFVLLR